MTKQVKSLHLFYRSKDKSNNSNSKDLGWEKKISSCKFLFFFKKGKTIRNIESQYIRTPNGTVTQVSRYNRMTKTAPPPCGTPPCWTWLNGVFVWRLRWCLTSGSWPGTQPPAGPSAAAALPGDSEPRAPAGSERQRGGTPLSCLYSQG